MTPFVRVSQVTKTFALAEEGHGTISLIDALRSGRREVRYRDITALDDVSLEVSAGDRVGIIGRNGAGKTTLLSIIAGISQPTSGSVEIEGDVHAMLSIGTVLRDDLTGRENVYLDGTVHGRTKEEIDRHIEDIVAFADIGEFIDRPVRTYSSGMKARVAFSMGAFIEPDIFIIDETLSVGDAFFADKAMRRMRELTARGRVVILVSHMLKSITEMCNRCIWLDNGQVVMDGEPEAVTAAYKASVDQADEADLARKFGSGENIAQAPERGAIEKITLSSGSAEIAASTVAFAPLTVRVAGTVHSALRADITLRILRVDGRVVWEERLSGMERQLSPGRFVVRVGFDPFILGANLYRIDAMLSDDSGPIDAGSRVFEVIDEEGQHGGQPFLYHPPVFRARRLAKA